MPMAHGPDLQLVLSATTWTCLLLGHEGADFHSLSCKLPDACCRADAARAGGGPPQLGCAKPRWLLLGIQVLTLADRDST